MNYRNNTPGNNPNNPNNPSNRNPQNPPDVTPSPQNQYQSNIPLESQNQSYGYLRVRVTEAGGAVPVSGALVRISEYDSYDDAGNTNDTNGTGDAALYSLITDRDGLTPTVRLAAPPAADSQAPMDAENGAPPTIPYSLYNVNISKGGYYPVENVGVPIFAGITAVQPVNLSPLTEQDDIAGVSGPDGRVMIYEFPDSESLMPGGVTREDIGNRNGEITGGNIVTESGGDSDERQ